MIERHLELKIFQNLQELLQVKIDNAKLPKNTVEIATIGAVLEDFDFELPIQVTSFKIKVPGQPSVEVNGNKIK